MENKFAETSLRVNAREGELVKFLQLTVVPKQVRSGQVTPRLAAD